jgi:hypothetical protein
MKITKEKDGKFVVEFDDDDICVPDTEELQEVIRIHILHPKERHLQTLKDSINKRGSSSSISEDLIPEVGISVCCGLHNCVEVGCLNPHWDDE